MPDQPFTHPSIPKPKTTLSPGPSGLWFETCHHCEWTCGPSVKSHVSELAMAHRNDHRRGRLAVTR